MVIKCLLRDYVFFPQLDDKSNIHYEIVMKMHNLKKIFNHVSHYGLSLGN